jgi:hypothetical protein
MKRRRKEHEQLEENAYQLRQWRAWHREELNKLLTGPHGAAVQALLEQLNKKLTNGRELIALVRSGPWREADANTRAEILHLLDQMIIRQRERNGLPAFDDPLPDDANPNAFLVLRAWLRCGPEPVSRENEGA